MQDFVKHVHGHLFVGDKVYYKVEWWEAKVHKSHPKFGELDDLMRHWELSAGTICRPLALF